MTDVLTQKLIEKVVDHEGMKKSAYQDSLGFWTIGVGLCIDERKNAGLTTDEIFYLLNSRLTAARNQLTQYEWFKRLDRIRQDAVVELCFNLGLGGLLSFKNMINSLATKSYSVAASDLKNSLWYKQVGSRRGDDLCFRIRNGQYS